MQPWIMVALAVDKLLCMRVNSIAILKKKWFQWSVVATIVLINIALYINMPISMKRREISPGYFKCDLTTIKFFFVNVIINLVETSFIPFIVMIITSILTTRKLIDSRNAVMKTTGKVSKERKSRDTKYAITSLSFNVLFIFLKLPSAIFFTLNAFFHYYNMYFARIVTLTFYLNSSLSFLVHLVTNSLFRQELLIFFKSTKRNSGSTNRPIPLIQASSSV
jgi:hypothetical protein